METKTDKLIFYFLMATAVGTMVYLAFLAFEESQIVTGDHFPNELDYQYLENGFIPSTLEDKLSA